MTLIFIALAIVNFSGGRYVRGIICLFWFLYDNAWVQANRKDEDW
jgi:hypothetical protein